MVMLVHVRDKHILLHQHNYYTVLRACNSRQKKNVTTIIITATTILFGREVSTPKDPHWIFAEQQQQRAAADERIN
jgi:hypothetical protein